ncbi:cytochrome b [Cognatiyoonia sp. IB215446]|uniref:cytochrome b n=1 Tax=Cognatiyoonia sp. IB215446 TaxID=3097355 RepID=UPI0039B78A26
MAPYPPLMRWLHWSTAALVLIQISLVLLNRAVYEAYPVLSEALIQGHISLGALILCVTLVRFGVRQGLDVPPAPTRPFVRRTARTMHLTFYVLLCALPVIGYAQLAFLGFELSLFSVVHLPSLPFNPTLAQTASLLHSSAGLFLGVLTLLHILVACFHRKLDGQPMLGRMLPSVKTRS